MYQLLIIAAQQFFFTEVAHHVYHSVLEIPISMCLRSSVSLTTSAFERGTGRNVEFACMEME